MLNKILLLVSLICLTFCRTALAQTSGSQGLWWEVRREFQVAPKGWQTPSYTASAPNGTSSKGTTPTVVGGQSFTINDFTKCPSGQIEVSGTATQSSLKIVMDANFLTKGGASSQVFGAYSFEPALYVENGDHAQIRVTVKVVSHAEGAAKLDDPQTQWMPFVQSKLNCLATIKHDPQKLFGGERTITAQPVVGPPSDSWKGDESFEETSTLLVSGELVGQLIESSDVFNAEWNPHMKWPFATKNKKGFYKIGWLALLSQFKNSPDFLNISLGNTARGGEASGIIKQELTITVERVGPTLPAEAAIGVDYNRDGPIDYDKADKTSAAKPFNFWLNTDKEISAKSENEQADADPKGEPDCADNRITSKRDLEDFTRLHIQAPAEFRADGTWKCKVNFTNTTGAPAIKLYESASAGPEYLIDSGTAATQLSVTSDVVVGSTPIEIPFQVFRSISKNKFRAAFIFEGIRAGRGTLQVHFYKGATEKTAKNPVYLSLRPIQDFYDYYALALVDLNRGATNPTINRPTAKDIAVSQTSDYILFVHGWRMQEWNKEAFAQTAFKRLWQRGYKGKFGLFSWPTEYVDTGWDMFKNETNRRNYERSEQKAWLSAAVLRNLLNTLNTTSPQRVRVFAHSMGNVVVSEALLLEAESQNPQKIAHTYVASQAATVAQAYDAGVHGVAGVGDIAGAGDLLPNPNSGIPNIYKAYPPTSQPYFDGTRGNGGISSVAGRLVNYYNPQDYALAPPIWGLNQSLKPDKGLRSDSDYGYESDNPLLGFYRERKGEKTVLQFPIDRYEIFAFAAPAYSQALGREVVAGPFSLNVNLGEAPFSFTGDMGDHSAQFNSNIMTRYKYWDQLMKDFGISVTPPK